MIVIMAEVVERATGDGKWTVGSAGFKACVGIMSAGCGPCAPFSRMERS